MDALSETQKQEVRFILIRAFFAPSTGLLPAPLRSAQLSSAQSDYIYVDAATLIQTLTLTHSLTRNEH